jgi:hypothetical protein
VILTALALEARAAPITPDQVLDEVQVFFAARLPKYVCDPPVTDFPRWVGFPVRRCRYSDGGVDVRTAMLNPTAQQLALWSVNACTDTGAKDAKSCALGIARVILSASSGVFPVEGYIPESASSGGGKGTQILCYYFRDGVTVRLDGVQGVPASINCACPVAGCPEEKVVRAMKFARVASTSRAEYVAHGGTDRVGTDADGDVRWVDVVRRQYQDAWRSDRNALIAARVSALRGAGKLP